ncbi:MAG TPA: AAA family ATPase [Polyangiaceae bacterium]|nr:AAA family ATPase [Polyangiaceae bacterium]
MRTLVVGEGDADFKGTERFEVIRRIGAGGMGVVYEAFDRERKAPVALKVMRTLEPETLFRFKNEFRVLEGIRHPNLIHLGELFEEGGRWFFTMELVHGQHFLDYLEQTGPGSRGSSLPSLPSLASESADITVSDGQRVSSQPSPPARSKRSRLQNEIDEEKLRDAMRQLAEGLYALHRAKKVHRDIKPSNILVTPEGRVVILDFGLAVDLETSLPEAYLVGTCWYMAPEQARLRPIGPAADWYSVGVLLYQALTGRLPIQGNAREVLYMKQLSEPAPPSRLADVPEDLDALCVDLLYVDPLDRPEGREILRRLGVTDAQALREVDAEVPHFVGRRTELEALRAAFSAARKEAGVTVFVHGESGVGKSALVRRFCELVAAEDVSAIVLSGRCYEREAVPYKAVDGVIDSLSRALGSLDAEDIAAILPADAGLLGVIFPVLRRIESVSQAPLPPLGTLEPTLLRSRLFLALRELFQGLAGRHPVIVAIDDLQWADADSLALLAEIMRSPGAPRLLLLVTLRAALRSEVPIAPSVEGPASSGVASVSNAPAPSSSPGELSVAPLRVQQIERLFLGDVRTMHIEGLPQSDARALVEALLQASKEGSTSDVSAAVAEEAGGHPLFIDELVRRRLLAGGGTGPLRLEDALWARIAKLEPEARRALELIVAAGAPLDQETAARAAGVEFNDFSEQVALLRAENLVRTSGARRADAVEPYHDRVREAVLLHQTSSSQKGLHDRLASALEASGRADPEALAYHYRRAGKLDKAAEHAAHAAELFANALAFDRAAALYQLSLELRPLEGPLGGALRAKLGDALANAGRGVEAAAAYLEAATRVPPSEALDIRRRAADQLLRTGHIDEAMDTFRSVLSAIGMTMPETPRTALASLLLRRAQVRLRGLRFTERPASEIPPETLTRFDVCWSVAAGLGLVDTIVGRYFQARCLLLALDAGEPHRIARALAMEASYSSASGGSNKARTARLVEATEALAYRVNDPYALGWAAAAAGVAGCLEGRWRSGHTYCERAESTFRDHCTGVYWEVGTMQWFSMWSQSYLGQLGELSRRVPARLREAAGRGDLYAAIGHSTGLANLVWLAADDVREARERSSEAMRQWSQRRFHVEHWWAMLGDRQIDLYVGDAEAAYKAVHAQWGALSGSLLLMVQLTKLEALQLRARAALMLAEGRPSDRESLCREAARDARSIEGEAMPWSDPLTALLRAGIAFTRGDADRALSELEQAEAGLVAADMGLYAAAARYRRGKLLGGDEGRALEDAARSWMAGQGVVNVERMVALHAPGFSGSQG